MATTRGLGVEIPITIKADASGAKEASAAIQSITKDVTDLARANGLSEESTKKVGEVVEDLTRKFSALDEAVAAGAITHEEATSQLIPAIQEAKEKVDALVEAEKKLDDTSKATADTLENKLTQGATKAADQAMRMKRELEADEKVMAKVRAEGDRLAGSFDYVSKTTGNVNKGLQLTNERAVMMGQVVGGLTAQMISGADGTQLMATGLTHMAMILSTAGPWGMAAGAAVTIVTSLVTGLMKANDQAKKTAEEGYKELQGIIEATNAELLKIDSEQHARALEKHKRAIDDIAESWKKSLESSRRYYQEQDARADADLGLKLSELALEKEERLAQVTDPIEREAIEEEYRTKERDAQFDADKAKMDRRQQQLEMEKQQAELKQRETDAQIKQLNEEIIATERAIQTDRPGVQSDQAKFVSDYESMLRTAMEKEAAAQELRDDLRTFSLKPKDPLAGFKLSQLEEEAKKAREDAESLRPGAEGARELMDSRRETYGEGERKLSPAEQMEVGAFLNRRKQEEDFLKQARQERDSLAQTRDDAYVASKSADEQLGNLAKDRDALINRSLREDVVSQKRSDAINERRRAYEENLTPADRNTRELNRRLNGVSDPQKRSEIELGFQKELEEKSQLDVQRDSLGNALKGAKGRDKMGDADLSEKVDKLAEAALSGTDQQKQTKAELEKAAQALRDGASQEELGQVAQLLQKTAESTDSSMQTLVKAAEAALERAKSNEDAIKRLEQRVRELK
jgi:hypothetical protein